VLVGEAGEAGETDAARRLMAHSPLDATGLPGPSLIVYMAGACMFRTPRYRQIGGYEPLFFIGGEETLVSVDVLAGGVAIVYAEEPIVRHHPSRCETARFGVGCSPEMPRGLHACACRGAKHGAPRGPPWA